MLFAICGVTVLTIIVKHYTCSFIRYLTIVVPIIRYQSTVNSAYWPAKTGKLETLIPNYAFTKNITMPVLTNWTINIFSMLEKISEVLVWEDSNLERPIIHKDNLRLTSKQCFDNDIDNCNTSSDHIDEGICKSELLKPSITIELSVTEFNIDDLEIDICKLVKTVAVHVADTLRSVKLLVTKCHLLSHLNARWACYHRRIILDILLVVLSNQQQHECDCDKDNAQKCSEWDAEKTFNTTAP